MAKILIIDDDADHRFLISEYLLDLGYEVAEAADGRQGVEKVFDEDPDLVLCDLRMPEMDGLEVLKTVVPRKPGLPIVVISGAGLMNDAIEALRQGAWDYLVKPVKDPHFLEHAIARSLERAHLLKIEQEYQQGLETEIRKSHQDLQTSRASLIEKSGVLEALFSSIPAGLYYLDPAGIFLDVNLPLAKLFEKSRQEMIGRSLQDFPELSSLPHLENPEREFHVRRFRIGDRDLDFGIKRSTIYSGEGRLIGTVGLVLDVTESIQEAAEAKKREQQILQADKMISLGILTAGVAHEINNPTQVIMSNAPVVRKAWQGIRTILDDHAEQHGDFPMAGLPYSRMREKLAQLLDSIEESAERIKNIVHGMKDFARFDAEDAREQLDVNPVLEKTLKLVGGRLRKCCHRLQVVYGENLPRIRGNPVQLEQVFVNLILNAAEALPSPDRAIEVSTTFHADTKNILVEFRDEGVGMPLDVLKNIFDPFYTTKRDMGGTGLGLAISNRIVQKHGGEILFVSEQGRGTIATVVLPVEVGDGAEGGGC
ncbi:MAG: response regulator [Syntrophotaleaceae bacterium]